MHLRTLITTFATLLLFTTTLHAQRYHLPGLPWGASPGEVMDTLLAQGYYLKGELATETYGYHNYSGSRVNVIFENRKLVSANAHYWVRPAEHFGQAADQLRRAYGLPHGARQATSSIAAESLRQWRSLPNTSPLVFGWADTDSYVTIALVRAHPTIGSLARLDASTSGRDPLAATRAQLAEEIRRLEATPEPKLYNPEILFIQRPTSALLDQIQPGRR